MPLSPIDYVSRKRQYNIHRFGYSRHFSLRTGVRQFTGESSLYDIRFNAIRLRSVFPPSFIFRNIINGFRSRLIFISFELGVIIIVKTSFNKGFTNLSFNYRTILPVLREITGSVN